MVHLLYHGSFTVLYHGSLILGYHHGSLTLPWFTCPPKVHLPNHILHSLPYLPSLTIPCSLTSTLVHYRTYLG